MKYHFPSSQKNFTLPMDWIVTAFERDVSNIQNRILWLLLVQNKVCLAKERVTAYFVSNSHSLK